MTDTNNNQPNSQQAPAAPKESAGSKIVGGISWWINSLMGKPQARKVPQAPVIQQAPVAETQTQVAQPQPQPTKVVPAAKDAPVETVTKAEDPILQDLSKIKSVLGMVGGKVGQTVKPVVSKGVDSSSKAATSFVKTVDKGFLQKLIRVFLIIIVLFVLAFVGFRFMTRFNEQGGGEGTVTPGTEVSSTPTPIVFVPDKPSIYASDELILQLEEDVNVLVNEIGGSNIQETNLNPPRLDFNVTF